MQTADLIAACAALPPMDFAPGDVLIAEGSRDNCLYVLLSGQVSILKSGDEVARVDTEGAIFGEMSALLGIPATASVVARTAVTTRVSEDAKGMIEKSPELTLHTARTLAQRLYLATAYLADIKKQFADRSDHFGLMDKILDELMRQQSKKQVTQPGVPNDPRL